MKLHGTWRNYHAGNSPLPKGMFISGMSAGQDGRVWMVLHKQEIRHEGRWTIGESRTTGIVLYEHDQWTFFSMGEAGLPKSNVDRIATDHYGHLWLYVHPETLCRFNGQTTTVFRAGEAGLPANGLPLVFLLSGNHKGEVWIVPDSDGVYQFRGRYWEQVAFTHPRFLSGDILALSADPLGRMWIAVQDDKEIGLLWYDGERWQEHTRIHIEMRDEQVQALAVDARGSLWVGWANAGDESRLGLWTFDVTHNQWTRYTTRNSALRLNEIKRIALDKAGRAWVGTPAGIVVFNGQESVNLRAVLPGGRHAWLSYEEWLQAQSEGDTRPVLINDDVVIDQLGQVWVWSSNGVCVYSEG